MKSTPVRAFVKADVVISHSSKTAETLQKVGRLAELLSQRWNVWWDDNLVGRFPRVIEEKIRNATCVIPVWTEAAHDSDWVQVELEFAQQCDAHILPVRMEPCKPPFGYVTFSSVDLTGWGGEDDHPAMLQLGRKLASVVAPAGAPQRPREIFGNRLELPALFMSISSHETQFEPLDGVRALRLFGANAVLVSAYDLLPERRAPAMVTELKKIRKAGGLVLVDSGNYEASRRDDVRWTPRQFKRALQDVPHDWAFSFDVMEPAPDARKAVRQIVAAVERDSRFTTQPVLPIVHLPYSKRSGYRADAIAQVVRQVAGELAPPMIAIPERELGQGLAQRATRVREIRRELDKLSFYQPLHLLGTGNPWSIAVLAAAGADSFDGLEWCRVAVDREANRLNHFQHFDLFTYQLGWIESPLVKSLVSDENANFSARVAFHNLDYFAQLGRDLRKASGKGNLETFVTAMLGAAYTKYIGKNVPSLFP